MGPILIVGPARSGTELMRSVLNRHPQVWIAHETHYFDDLRPRLRRPHAPLAGPEAALANSYFGRLDQHGYGLRAAGPRSPAPGATGASADDLFAAHCSGRAQARGREVWGEKTPRHVFRGDEILRAFPDARIVAMVRDPRAATASYRDWRNRWFDRDEIDDDLAATVAREEARVRRSYSLTVSALLWRSAAGAARNLARSRPESVRLVRFEDLTGDPEPTIRGLMDWLGLPYVSDLLDVEVANSSYIDRAAERGFQRVAETRWRQTLTSDETAYVDWLTGAIAQRLGYAASPERLRQAYAVRELVGLPVAAVRAMAANRDRIPRLGPYLLARLRSALSG